MASWLKNHLEQSIFHAIQKDLSKNYLLTEEDNQTLLEIVQFGLMKWNYRIIKPDDNQMQEKIKAFKETLQKRENL